MSIKLGPVVGATTHNEAKIWVQTQEPMTLKYRVYTNPEGTEELPDSPFICKTEEQNSCTGVATLTLPKGDTRYYYRIFMQKGNRSVPISQTLSFQTFPSPNKKIESFSFGLVSCHKPTNFDSKKELSLRNMWRHLFTEMYSHRAAFLLTVGDQVYADHEKSNAWQESLDGSSPKPPLELYREAYYNHWVFPEMQAVLGNFPTFMIWDDHEITNGWGSSKKHKEKRAQDIFLVARKVYEDFQHSHNPTPLTLPQNHQSTPGHVPYYYAFRCGPAAFLVLDLRGNRKMWEGQLLGPDQWAAIRHWFNSKEARDSQVLFVITSVPAIHLSRVLAKLFWRRSTDIADQWSAPHNKEERRELLKLLFDKYIENGKRKAFILGGDVHVGTVARVTEDKKSIYQFTSSPISNKPAKLWESFLKIFSSKFEFNLEKDGSRPVNAEIFRRYRQRNFGIVTVTLDSPPKVTLEMYQEGEGQPDVFSV